MMIQMIALRAPEFRLFPRASALLWSVLLTVTLAVKAEDASQQYRWVTEAWDDYTQTNGIGFYHDLMRLLLADTGVELSVSYKPWMRALREVSQGQADTTGADAPSDELLPSEYPLFFVLDAALVKKGRLPRWEGYQSLQGLTGVTLLGVFANKPDMQPYFNVSEVNSRQQALYMLEARDVIDYYYDNWDQMSLAMESHPGGIDPERYEIHTFRSGEVFWLFARTDKGRAFKEVFDRRFRESYCSGDLWRLYKHWDLDGEFPRIEVPCTGER